MNQTEQILSQLRDVRLPPAPESVPAWLIGLNLLLLILILAGIYLRWHLGRETWRRDALGVIKRAASMEPDIARLELARLLRQILLLQHRNLSADGDAWLAQLDIAFDTSWFTRAQGQVFGNALYRPSTLTDTELQGLCNALAQLIRKLPAKTQTPTQQANHRKRR